MIAFLIPLLRGALVSTVHIKVLSQEDGDGSVVIGPQINPGAMVQAWNSSVMDTIIFSTVNPKLIDKQPYVWSTDPKNFNFTSLYTVNNSSVNAVYVLRKGLFTTTSPVGTDTGVLRNLALQLNVSVSCTSVAQSDFPSSCSGVNPLNLNFSNINGSESAPYGDSQNPRFRARICAPGDIGTSPWKYTSDRQDVYEELWLDFRWTADPPDHPYAGYNYTQHCYGNSTLGCFELPNYWNGYAAGGLLDKMPPNGRNLSYRNGDDLLLTGGRDTERDDHGTASPFLTAVLAIFGPMTFFNTVASNNANTEKLICSQLRYPFTGLSTISSRWNQSTPFLYCPNKGPNENYLPLLDALLQWMPNFGDDAKASAALNLATYAASNAIMNVGAVPRSGYFLHASAGSDLQKPTMSLAAMVVITLLLAVQLAGLAFLAIYASRHPSWTASLDAWAMLRIGAEIGLDVPAVSALEARRAKVLDERKGWIGDAGVEGRAMGLECRELVLGGSGRVREGARYRMVRHQDKGEDGEI